MNEWWVAVYLEKEKEKEKEDKRNRESEIGRRKW